MSYSASDLARLLASNPDLQIDGVVEERAPLAAKQPKPKLSEHEMQVAIIAECDSRAVTISEYGLIFAIPNGGHRHPAVAAKLKAEGVRPGVLDLFLPVQRHGYGGMFLELKVGGNEASEVQEEWIRRLTGEGYFCRVIWDSVDEVMSLIEWYLEGEIE